MLAIDSDQVIVTDFVEPLTVKALDSSLDTRTSSDDAPWLRAPSDFSDVPAFHNLRCAPTRSRVTAPQRLHQSTPRHLGDNGRAVHTVTTPAAARVTSAEQVRQRDGDVARRPVVEIVRCQTLQVEVPGLNAPMN